MAVSADNLRFILGLKLKTLRQERGLSLKATADRAGMSISYLSEIEKGKKYPKPEKLLDLATALGVAFDDLVSLQVSDRLDPVKSVFSSPFVREFPFELFGLEAEDLFSLIRDEPRKAGALVQTFVEIGKMYDVGVEHFLFAALRSYQQLHGNYLEEIEEAAARFRRAHDWGSDPFVDEDALRTVLAADYGYRINESALPNDPDLKGFRSVYVAGRPPTLCLNGRLLPAQKAFILGREIGYRYLGLRERAVTSSWLKVESFDQLLNNLKASYFSGAVLIEREALLAGAEALFARDTWDDGAFLDLLSGYNATPEMLFYRLSELLPERFGLKELFFVRFSNRVGSDFMRLTKVLNMSRAPVPHGIGFDEHYCRRWPGMKLLRRLAAEQAAGTSDAAEGARPVVRVQRSRFVDEGSTFFIISLVRPLSLTANTNTSVSLGFLLDDDFKRTVRFWNDPAIPDLDVNLTCERCGLTAAECQDRVAPPSIFEAERAQARKEEALRVLMERIGGEGR